MTGGAPGSPSVHAQQRRRSFFLVVEFAFAQPLAEFRPRRIVASCDPAGNDSRPTAAGVEDAFFGQGPRAMPHLRCYA